MTNPHVGPALDCTRARALIDAFLLDELGSADAARLAAHVKGCAACAAEIGSSTRVLGLLGSLPVQRPMPDLDERILMAALDDRARRHAHRSWLSDLRTQVIRGAMRTTGTLLVTILSVALLGGAFVFAASQVVAQLPVFTQRATLPPVATPTTSVPAAQTAEPSTTDTPRPSGPHAEDSTRRVGDGGRASLGHHLRDSSARPALARQGCDPRRAGNDQHRIRLLVPIYLFFVTCIPFSTMVVGAIRFRTGGLAPRRRTT